ncbi:MAG: cobyric acid synthase CobQ [Gomphosphaeria aponina SAG 52.96 = DSM 107014]|uniref:Cobyric acid synthase n=1 Tax=Gomphosphaeria aponina SAG 52.96 = DSM 107014 TaxID=1521640 RepID=A0A941GXX5_9CHRO|nr:cobyric acid synthase CobQ [Gomphosphaeria aponina SAG 52.96 = DSM 107014]
MPGIMVVGTTSHAGKSLLTAAICRLLSRQGWRVTPFKGQNMALNAYVTETGGEMGYAQAVQAWAAKITPRVEMNPILLKPQGDLTSQVIIRGKVVGKTTAEEYYKNYFERGWLAIQECLSQLAIDYDLVICEGAGSPAEINLKHRDLTNMRVAKYLNAPTLLVVDIDRGGAFAHVVGTWQLLEPEERSLIKGIVINKFRGQKSLLDSGITWLEAYINIPVIGVIPWLDQVFPAEDSLDLFERRSRQEKRDLQISVIRLPRIANFTDFEPLETEATVTLEYVNLNESLGNPDAVIIPGSKTTIADLIALYESGMAAQLQAYINSGGTVMGICGGFQILGQQVTDPDKIEGENEKYLGLNLLPIKTTLTQEKITRQRQVFTQYPQKFAIEGYEIHQGKTEIIKENGEDFFPLFDDPELGLVNREQSLWGCYLHGLFDHGQFRRAWLNILRQKRGMSSLPTEVPNYHQQRDIMFDSLADFVEKHLDLTPIMAELVKQREQKNEH